jgi:hypothetical protein
MVKSSRTAIDAIVEEYLRALQAYAGEVRLPGLDISSALPLDKIFIEPRLTSSEKTTQTEDGKAARVDLAEPTPPRLISSEKTTQTQDGKAARVDLTEPTPELASSILAREQSLVLLAEPGRGKSTLLRQYGWKLASNTNRSRFPILVELGRKPNKIEDSDPHFAWLYERLPELLKNRLGTRGWAAVCSVINAGGASILIDGFDELTRQAQRQVSELVHTLKGNQVVLTSRPHEYRLMEFSGFKRYNLLELTSNQVADFARTAVEALARQYRGVDYHIPLQDLLEISQGAAQSMLRNPLLLSFLCLTAIDRCVKNSSARLPTRRVPLIRDCIEALVAWQREHKVPTHWPDTLTGSEVIRTLAPVALSTFKTDSGGLITQNAIEEMSDDDKQRTVRYLIPNYFIVRAESGYVFPFETFREFYAAKAIAATADPFAAIGSNLHNTKWRQLIIYTAGSMEKVETSRIDLMAPRLWSLLARFPIAFLKALGGVGAAALDPASKIAGAAVKGVVGIGEAAHGPLERWLASSRRSTEYFVTSILKRGSRYEDLLRRDWALAIHCLAESPGCTDTLTLRLASLLPRSQDEKVWMIQHLGIAARHRQIQAILLKRTQDDADALAQEAAVKALSDVIVEPSVQTCLLDLLSRRRSTAATAALSKVAADPSVIGRLLELAERPDEHPEAIEVLAKAASDQRVQDLLLNLTHQSDKAVRSRAIKALAGAAFNTRVQERLLELTHEAGKDIAMEAVEAMASAASETRVQERLLELTHEADNDIAMEAVGAMASAASETWVRERLLEITRASHTNQDLWICKAISALRKDVSIPAVLDRLIELSRDRYVTVAQEAAKALAGATADPRVKDHLLSLEHHPSVIGAAMEALADVASDSRVRERFIELSKPQKGKYVHWYYFFPEDDEIFVRQPAVEGLMRLPPDPELCALMLHLITDYTMVLRERAAHWLFWAAPSQPAIRERLLELTRLDDRFCHIRMAAVAVLGAIATEPSVRSRLLELTYDSDPAICREAAWSLEKAASDRRVGERLLALTHGRGYPNRYSAVRVAAARALEGLPKEAVTKKVLKRVAQVARRDDPALISLWTLVQAYEELRMNPRRRIG